MKRKYKILVIDSDDTFRQALVDQFRINDEFNVKAVATAVEGINEMHDRQADLVLCAVTLLDIDGYEVCKIMRRNGHMTPLILLTARDSEADAILALESGADDYVSKPFRFSILMARIRARLRQYGLSEDAVLRIGPYSFGVSSKVLTTADGATVRLTDKEVAILKHLYRAGQGGMSRDVLLEAVWGYNSDVASHALETHIYRLRKKIERDPSLPEIVVTEAGGYKLNP